MGGQSVHGRNRAVACIVAAAVALAAWPATGSAIEADELVTELAWSIRVGGMYHDYAMDLEVASDGSTFLTGVVQSDWPTTPSPGSGGENSMLVKLGPAGELLVAKRLPKGAYRGYSVAIDPLGGVYVVGEGVSSSELVTAGAFQTTFGGGMFDAFVARLDESGNVEWATYLGGEGIDKAVHVAVDDEGSAYVVGRTGSADFPLRNAAQATFGGHHDGYVAKFTRSGELTYSTFIGGPGYDPAKHVIVDGREAIVSGSAPTSFPHTTKIGPGGGSSDAYVVRVHADGTFGEKILMGGGNLDDANGGVALASNGDVVLAGRTYSVDFPTSDAWQSTYGGGGDAFLARLDLDNGTLLRSTYFGLASRDDSESVALDAEGRAWLVGVTGKVHPKGALMPSPLGGTEGFVAAFDETFTPVFATYLGGSGDDALRAVGVTPAGGVIVAGLTRSPDFPTLGSPQAAPGGHNDLIATHVRLGCVVDPLPVPTTLVDLSGPVGLAGWHRGAVDVSLSVEPWCSYAATHAGLDGGALLDRLRLTVTGDGAHELAVRSVALDGREEETRIVPVRIDAAPPEIALDTDCPSPGLDWWCTQPFEAGVTVSDATSGVAASRCRLDGVDVDCVAPMLVTEGRHFLAVDVTDVAGNAFSKSARMGVDGTPPTVTLTLPDVPPLGAFTEPVQVAASASDVTSGVASLVLEVDGVAADGTAAYLSTDGVHRVVARATDAAGNTAIAETTVAIDLLPPVTTLDLIGIAGEPGTWRSAVSAALTAVDVSPVETWFSLDGGEWTMGNALGVEVEGIHTLDYFSRDAVGREESPRSARVTVDFSAPTTTVLAPHAGPTGWITTPAVAKLVASDAISGVSRTLVRVGSGDEFVATEVALPDGAYDLRYRSTDRAGNEEAEQRLAVRVDATPPVTVAALAGEAGEAGWWRSAVHVELDASDAASGVASTWQSVDGVRRTEAAGTRIVEDGVHTIGFGSVDAAGNAEPERSVTVPIDGRAPALHFATPQVGSMYVRGVRAPADAATLTALAPTADAVVLGPLLLEAPATDATSGVVRVEYYLDGVLLGRALEAPWGLAWDAGAATPGTHVLHARAVDAAGNAATVSMKVITAPAA